MKKDDLLRSIAQKGYDVGFGAKKHFASYDIIEKAPGLIGFLSMTFGIISLAVENSPTKLISSGFVVLGVIGLYVSMRDHEKAEYEQCGVALTKLFNELKALYLHVKATDEHTDFTDFAAKLSELESKYYNSCMSKQILLSNWYAHYKFFWEHQIDWIDEQLKFGLFRDKVPLSLWFLSLCTLSALGYFWFQSDVVELFCSLVNKAVEE
ncbi:SLATT domain-containing protein [Marinomonas gallaica]|uniref:SLATT domain-containing protein n=1 Tax=Marinomonas gallaica TaxID=1806667 RepID=UPI003A8DE669